MYCDIWLFMETYIIYEAFLRDVRVGAEDCLGIITMSH